MRVYLGGPINGCTDEEATGWRDEVAAWLNDHGHTPVDPMVRDYRGREMEPGIAKEIVERDKDDIMGSDLLLMSCPKPSVGTSMEILFGHRFGKAIIAVIPDDGRDPSPWLVYHADIYRGSVLDAIKEELG